MLYHLHRTLRSEEARDGAALLAHIVAVWEPAVSGDRTVLL